MPTVRLFAQARQAAGRGSDDIPGSTVGEVLDRACERYGPGFAAILPSCQVMRNRDLVDRSAVLGAEDEVAVLPPVSGGCR